MARYKVQGTKYLSRLAQEVQRVLAKGWRRKTRPMVRLIIIKTETRLSSKGHPRRILSNDCGSTRRIKVRVNSRTRRNRRLISRCEAIRVYRGVLNCIFAILGIMQTILPGYVRSIRHGTVRVGSVNTPVAVFTKVQTRLSLVLKRAIYCESREFR